MIYIYKKKSHVKRQIDNSIFLGIISRMKPLSCGTFLLPFKQPTVNLAFHTPQHTN